MNLPKAELCIQIDGRDILASDFQNNLTVSDTAKIQPMGKQFFCQAFFSVIGVRGNIQNFRIIADYTAQQISGDFPVFTAYAV